MVVIKSKLYKFIEDTKIMRIHLLLDNELDKAYLEQLCDIDRAAYQLEPTPQALVWAERKPWMYHILRRGDEVLGYTLVIPLRKIAYDAMKQGRIWEEELRVSDIDGTDPKGFYGGSIAASPKVRFNRQPFITGTLCGILGGQLGRSSREIIAIPITEAGQNLAEMLKMFPITSELDIKGVDGYSPKVFFKPLYKRRTPLNVGNRLVRVII